MFKCSTLSQLISIRPCSNLVDFTFVKDRGGKNGCWNEKCKSQLMIRMSRAMCLCSVSTINTDHLRSQLDQLHSEAEFTRRKASNARFRLLRLSETAENLRRQAAISVQKRKEDDARELLLQKKKIKLALEKSKGRIELLDELASKLTEAISVKEAQLVRNVSSDFEAVGDGAGGPVRIVSPTQDNRNTLDYDYNNTFNQSDVGKDHELVSDIDSEGNMSYYEAEVAILESISSANEASNLRVPSSFTDFLEELDQQLDNVENDLVNIFELSTIALDSMEKPDDLKLQQLKILENIRGARLRIGKYVQEISGN